MIDGRARSNQAYFQQTLRFRKAFDSHVIPLFLIRFLDSTLYFLSCSIHTSKLPLHLLLGHT